MRALVQMQVVGESIYALDDDGVLWFGVLTSNIDDTGAFLADWTPICPPNDDPPFTDLRDELERVVDRICKDTERRAAIEAHLAQLPAIKSS